MSAGSLRHWLGVLIRLAVNGWAPLATWAGVHEAYKIGLRARRAGTDVSSHRGVGFKMFGG